MASAARCQQIAKCDLQLLSTGAFMHGVTDAVADMAILKPASNSSDISEDVADAVISKYADMMNVDAHDISNYPLYHFIDEWYGTAYRWGGEDNLGVDCSAFSKKLYENVFGISLDRTARQQQKSCELINSEGDAGAGDLIFFRMHHFRVSHVGVYLANGFFVHASRSQGVVISSLSNKYWRRRFAGCGKVEKTEAPMESDGLQ